MLAHSARTPSCDGMRRPVITVGFRDGSPPPREGDGFAVARVAGLSPCRRLSAHAARGYWFPRSVICSCQLPVYDSGHLGVKAAISLLSIDKEVASEHTTRARQGQVLGNLYYAHQGRSLVAAQAPGSPVVTSQQAGRRGNMTETSQAGHSRIPAVLGAIGGALVAGAYFLPWTVGVDNPGAPDVKLRVQSAWISIYQLATGGSYYNSQYHLTENTPAFPFEAFLAGAPLVMGVIMLALGIWGVFQRPGALRQGMFLAAALLAVVSSQSLGNLQSLITTSALTQRNNIPNQSLLGLGQSVLYVGLFVAASAGISALLTRERQPSA